MKNKKLLTLTMAISLILSFTACNNNASPPEESKPIATIAPVETTTIPSEETPDFATWEAKTKEAETQTKEILAKSNLKLGDLAEAMFIYNELIEEAEKFDINTLSAEEKTRYADILKKMSESVKEWRKRYEDNLTHEEKKRLNDAYNGSDDEPMPTFDLD